MAITGLTPQWNYNIFHINMLIILNFTQGAKRACTDRNPPQPYNSNAVSAHRSIVHVC